jgi:hypothetical protein
MERSDAGRARWVAVGLALGLGAVVVVVAVVRGLGVHAGGAGEREIRALSKDPVLAFRAPGTELRGREEHRSRRDPIGEGESTSTIRQTFGLDGEPGDTVEAYRQAAQADGWAFVVDGCSRVDRATAAVFGKRSGGFDATLVVRAQLDQADAGGDAGEATRRGLLVTLEAAPAGLESLPVDAGLQRNDVQCLRQLDPADPDLQPPPTAPLRPEDLCAAIPVDAAKAIAPQAVGVEPQGDRECWLVDAGGFPLFVVEEARRPRAYYDDRRLSTTEAQGQILFSVYGKKNPGLARSVWVATTTRALVVGTGGARLTEGQTAEDVLVAFAGLLR